MGRARRWSLLLFVLAIGVPGGANAADSGLFDPYVARATGSSPEAVAIGDVNHDGRNDVVLATWFTFDDENDHRLHVFLQGADGSLQPAVKYLLGNYPQSIDIGDLDGDGRNDVVVANNSGSIGVLTQNASGTLNPMVPYATTNKLCVRVGDFNHDGRLDVVSIGHGTNTASLFLQTEGGTLAPPVVYPVQHGGYEDLEVGDVNDDGLLDVVVMSGQGLAPNVGVLLQQAAGGLAPAVYHELPGDQLTSGVAVGDANGDARADLVVSHGGNVPNSFLSVFHQNAGGTLDPPVTRPSFHIPESVVTTDVDMDGRHDVLVLHGGWEKMGIYRQDASGALTAEALDAIPYSSHYNPHGFAVGDVNGDGLPDAVIADYYYGLVLLYHRPTNLLSVSVTDGPDPAVVGADVTYTFTVTNHRRGPTAGVTLTDTLPKRMKFVSATPDAGNCTIASKTVTCILGTMASGSFLDVTIVGRVDVQRRAERTYRNKVHVTASEVDIELSDNVAEATTRYVLQCSHPLRGRCSSDVDLTNDRVVVTSRPGRR